MSLFKTPWTSQPQYPVRVLDIEGKETSIWNFGEGVVRNSRTNSIAALATNTKIDANAFGKCLKTTSTTSAKIQIGTDTSLFGASTSDGVTIFFVHKKSDTTNRTSGLFGSNTGDRFGAHFPYSDGTIYWDPSTAHRLSVASQTFELAAWALTAGPRGLEIWKNGRKIASNASTGARTSGGDAIFLNDYTNSGSDLCELGLFGIANGQLSSGFLSAWRLNNLSFFEPVEDVIYVTSAGGGSFTLNADAGSYTLTGQAAKFDLTQSSSSGAYSLTGSTSSFDLEINLDAGSYAITGSAADLIATGVGSVTLNADVGSYSITGQPATFDIEENLAAGSYSLTGQASTFDLTMLAGVGSYTITGAAADLIAQVSVTIDAEPGAYSITGFDANLIATGQSRGDGSGWERFKDLKPLKKRLKEKKLPEPIIDIIEEIVEEQEVDAPVRKPVSILKQELKEKEIAYEPIYGEILKLELKLAIQAQKQLIYDQEEEELFLRMAA